MYLKRNYPIQKIDGREVIPNLWIEQDANSPHLYTDNQVCVKEQDILVDAGACEGNFTLFHIDKVKKAYLVECDMEWMEALKHTFAPYKEKVVFCNKFLGDIDDETHITIDVLIADEELNFLKMDVEGAEINSLNGAEASIRESKDFRCAICAYHKRGDKERIIEMLTQMGVSRTYASKGYMIFLHDQEVLENPELRKGIVRGIKA